MGDLISAELQFLRINLIKRLNNAEYLFTFGEMVNLITIIDECLKAGYGSILYLLSTLHNKKMDLYITKVLLLRNHLVNNNHNLEFLDYYEKSR